MRNPPSSRVPVALFEGLLETEIQAVMSSAARQVVPAGTVLFRQGDRASWMCLLEAGKVKLTRTTVEGLDILLRCPRTDR